MAPLIFWLIALAMPLPLVVVYLWRLWDIEQYSFFPVLFVAIGAMAYTRWNKQFRLPSSWFTSLTLALGFAIQLAASVLWSPWLAFLGFLLVATSLFASQREKPEKEGHEPFSSGSLFYLSIPLWLCLRIPLGQDQLLTLKLQHITAKVSSYILDFLKIPHQITGVVFDLPGGKLFVEEACSGVQSLFALLCIAFLLLAFNRRPIVLIPIYALAAIFSAGLFNIVRVTAIAIAQERYSYNLAEGVPHEILGYTCLICAILLLASFDRLFRVLFFPLSDSEIPLGRQRIPNPFKILWNSSLTLRSQEKSRPQWVIFQNTLLGIVVGGLALFAVGLQLFFGAELILASSSSSSKPAPIWLPSADVLSTNEDFVVESYEHKQGDYDISDGEYVDVWSIYTRETGLHHRVAISQPYKIYHELCLCYQGLGWQQLTQTRIASRDRADAGDWPFTFATFADAGGNYGYLSFSAFDASGNAIPAPDVNISDLIDTRMLSGRLHKLESNKVIMVQIWTTSDFKLDDSQIDKLQNLQIQLRQKIVDSLKSQRSVSP